MGMTGVSAAIHFSRPAGTGRSADQQAVRSPLGSALKSMRNKPLSSLRRGKASYSSASVVVGARSGGGGFSDGGGQLGAIEARPLYQKDKPSSDDWPLTIGSQTGGKGNKVIPGTAGNA